MNILEKDPKKLKRKPKKDCQSEGGKGAGGRPGRGGGGGTSDKNTKNDVFKDYEHRKGRTQEHSGPSKEEEKFYFGDDKD